MREGQQSEFSALIEALAAESLSHLPGMGRRDRRAAETRLRLFRSALQLFAERGYPNVTVEDITEAADVGKGTFFNYFESKDQVLGVLAEIQLGKVRQCLDEAISGKDSIESVLHHLFQRVAEEPGRSPELARAAISSFLASESIRAQVARAMSDGRGMVAEIIALGQTRREIDPSLNKDEVALQAQQAAMGTMLLWSLRGEPELATAMEATYRHFWRAIAPGKSRGEQPLPGASR
jgi:AcrR family transcriptional regulator